MSEYKEFWIQASNMIAHDDKPPTVKPCFHVIEYAAFEKLKKQNEIMRNALEFYADVENWHHISPDIAKYTVIANDEGYGEFQFNSFTDDFRVGGKRARQALKDVEGVG